MFKKKRHRKSPGFMGRFFRSLFAILVLTGLVYGLSLSIRGIYSLDSETFANYASPLLSRVGFSAEKTGEVAGEFVERFSQTGINTPPRLESQYSAYERGLEESATSASTAESPSILSDSDEQPVMRLAVMSDAHEDWDYFEKALNNAKALNADYVFYLGDLTDWGDVTTLEEGRQLLDASGLPWEAIPGDHDLAQSASRNEGYGLENFLEVFKYDYKIVEFGDLRLMLFDNGANFTTIDEERFTWFLNNINDVDFVFLSQPLYHPTSPIIMGTVDGEETKEVVQQRNILLNEIRNSDVKAVVAGDQHRSSVSADEENSELDHIVVGALTKRRNVQTPRYSILNIFEDGNYTIDEVIL